MDALLGSRRPEIELISVLANAPSDRPPIAQSLGRIRPDARAVAPALVDVFKVDSDREKSAVAEALKAINPQAPALEGTRREARWDRRANGDC